LGSLLRGTFAPRTIRYFVTEWGCTYPIAFKLSTGRHAFLVRSSSGTFTKILVTMIPDPGRTFYSHFRLGSQRLRFVLRGQRHNSAEVIMPLTLQGQSTCEAQLADNVTWV
jgi:hypothetical protein